MSASFRCRLQRCPVVARVAVAALACAAVIVASGNAHAQVIDQYLNTDIPGYGAGAGVTVASRSHSEYDMTGVRVGLFTITPLLDESFGYDDNVTGTAVAHGSPVIETNASVGASADWGLTQASGAVKVDDDEYLSQSSQSNTSWTVAAGVSHSFGQDTLYVGATHLNLTQTPRGLDVPSLDSAISYRVDDARADYKIDFGRLYVQPGIQVSNYSFDDGTTLGMPYLQSYRDRVVVSPSVEASYELATRRRIVVVVRDTQSDFSHSIASIPRQNFNDVSVLGGLAYDADGIIGFRLLAGYERRSFSSAAYRTIQAPIVEGAITWTPTGLTTITGTAARYIEDSAAESTVGFTETALKLNVDHELYRNIVLNANGAAYLDDYAGGGNQSYYTVGVGATWLVNRNVRVIADYVFSARQSSNNVPVVFSPTQQIFGSNYTDNVFLLRLKFGL